MFDVVERLTCIIYLFAADAQTSALDSANEALIMEQLRSLSAGKPSIIIAHRLSTIRDADEIIVLGGPGNGQGDHTVVDDDPSTVDDTMNDAGRIVERGTHDQLLQANGLYARLWRQQTRSGSHASRE